MKIIGLLVFVKLAQCMHQNGVDMDFQNLNIINHTNDTFSNVNGRIKKFNHTAYVIEMELDVNRPLGESVTVSITYFALQGNEYREIFENEQVNICEILQNDHYLYKTMLENSNLPPGQQCPIPPQHVSILPHEAAITEIPGILLTATNWKFLVQFYDQRMPQLELELYLTITKY